MIQKKLKTPLMNYLKNQELSQHSEQVCDAIDLLFYEAQG